MAGAGMNNIKARIKSVKSTMQITGAMELVATSKLRRFKERVERTRPFYETLGGAISEVIAAAELTDSPYVKKKEGRPRLIVVIAGDRGLAGGYNTNVYRLAASLAGEGDVILPIGKKACEYYKHKGASVFGASVSDVTSLGVGDALALGECITEAYLSGEFGEVLVIYTRFVSMLTQSPVYERLLPLSLDEEREDASLPEYDMEPEEMLDSIVPRYVGGVLYAAISEALASESGARRTAMNSANKNAKEMIDGLMLSYNRARQAIITQEITEIVSGAEALST
ncbi:MAG: ATP synthase F1 subunit gamma [Clostridia bacterium]|nr:ATP synthase F1 subunit gamma [Clostridia bacterium]